uniref:Uncharacterized protein n=1 Tax=uncultured prokaryote TaxID=198431 RepID=A0A0H5Q7B9_9ZZZZ|nr:hypothetical protein [uncultured prokaryote]
MSDETPIYRLSERRKLERQIAQSRYRQVRLTFTQEQGGRCSYSIYAKGLNATWSEHQCLVRDSVVFPSPLLSTEDVCHALITMLRDQFLPGSLGD